MKKFQALLEPKLGKATKAELTPLLGAPVSCVPDSRYERCEYRSTHAQNRPVSDTYRKQPGMGPDLTPYDSFDVLHLYFDNLGTLREWEPVVIQPD